MKKENERYFELSFEADGLRGGICVIDEADAQFVLNMSRKSIMPYGEFAPGRTIPVKGCFSMWEVGKDVYSAYLKSEASSSADDELSSLMEHMSYDYDTGLVTEDDDDYCDMEGYDWSEHEYVKITYLPNSEPLVPNLGVIPQTVLNKWHS